jgi:hypothetical protein
LLVQFDNFLRLRFQLISSLAQFLEQPRVLDGDDGLIGETRDKCDLLVGKGTNLLAGQAKCADLRSPSASEHRDTSARHQVRPLQRILAKISQEMLAEMIGMTRSRVSFFMNKFRKLGFIAYNGGIEVHSSAAKANGATDEEIR